MKRVLCSFALVICIALLSGCADNNNSDKYKQAQDETVSEKIIINEAENSEDDNTDNESETNNMDETSENNSDVEKSEEFVFRDVFGEEYTAIINKAVEPKKYKEKFSYNSDKRMEYCDENIKTLLGVDVSHHQGNIDWDKVKRAGYDFAFLRIGYRGYGKEGSINLDKKFDENIVNAHNAGIMVGVYFFAQAINEAEAIEEADFVLEHLSNYDLELPVIYDPESILDAEARTDNVTGEQFTQNTIAFCERIKEKSDGKFVPGLYANMLWEAFEIDLSMLNKEIPIWYADYEEQPQTPYKFSYWQYTNEGTVDGIGGQVDIDIWMDAE